MITQKQFRETLFIPVDGVELGGELIIPPGAKSLVIFAHGSGSSRFSPRNNHIAELFHASNTATFLFDLLSRNEDAAYENRFNIGLLTNRLTEATQYLSHYADTKKLTFGYFGASTGAASALCAAGRLPHLIHAVVSRGGRPDLALAELSDVAAPTLLIVGEKDPDVIQLNKSILHRLHCIKKMEIVEGATHLFEEDGALDEVARLAIEWFDKYLVAK